MLNDTRPYPRLESSGCCALAHATEALIDTLEADAAVSRVFAGPPPEDYLYVGIPGAATTTDQRRDLREWLMNPHSPFEHYRSQPQSSQASLLRSSCLDDEHQLEDFFLPLAPQICVTTGICMTLPIGAKTRCVIVCVRFNDRDPFNDADMDQLHQMIPTVTRVIQQGYLRQLDKDNHARPGGAFVPGPQSMDDLMDRLSKTEHAVLERLGQHETERQIAEAVGRSPHTIHVHVKSIYRKLMVTSRRELLEMLEQTGMAG